MHDYHFEPQRWKLASSMSLDLNIFSFMYRFIFKWCHPMFEFPFSTSYIQNLLSFDLNLSQVSTCLESISLPTWFNVHIGVVSCGCPHWCNPIISLFFHMWTLDQPSHKLEFTSWNHWHKIGIFNVIQLKLNSLFPNNLQTNTYGCLDFYCQIKHKIWFF